MNTALATKSAESPATGESRPRRTWSLREVMQIVREREASERAPRPAPEPMLGYHLVTDGVQLGPCVRCELCGESGILGQSIVGHRTLLHIWCAE